MYGFTVAVSERRISPEEVVPFALHVIDARVKLIPVLRPCRRGHQVVRQARRGGLRVGVDELRGDRVPAIFSDHVIRERPGEWPFRSPLRPSLTDRRWFPPLAEVSLPHFCRRHRIDEHPSDVLAEAIVVGEEKGPVAG